MRGKLLRFAWKTASIAALALVAACGQSAAQCDAIQTAIVTSYSQDPGCTSPVGVCTAGNTSVGDLVGSTRFTALTMGAGPSPDVILYSGDLTITTNSGTLTLRDRGLLNSATGFYFEMQQIVSGTGAYAERTGILISQGMASQTGFSGQLTGAICPLQ